MDYPRWLAVDCQLHGALKYVGKLNAMMNVQSRTIAGIKVVFDKYDLLRTGARQNVGVQVQGRWGSTRNAGRQSREKKQTEDSYYASH
jgi:hypothetical protein